MSTAVVYNRSLSVLFQGYAKKISEALESKGEEVFLLSNTDLYSMKDTDIKFQKAVFFDKDILCGLRLERLGVRLFNSIGAIDTCDDKRLTYEALTGIVPMPDTLFFPLLFSKDPDYVKAFVADITNRLGFPVVAKRARGSLGKDVFLISEKEEAESFILENYFSSILFCRFIKESYGRDVRAYCVGNRVIAAMKRENCNDFRSNIALGGKGTPYVLNKDEIKICLDAKSAIGLDFCGIDLLFQNGRPSLVCEVNSNAMFGEIDRVCDSDIAEEIASYTISSRIRSQEEGPFPF